MSYGKPKDLVRRTESDIVLKDKAFNTASDSKYDGYQRESAWIIYKLFDKKFASLNKSSGSGTANETNYQLANELHKRIIRKLKKQKVYSCFRNSIWDVDLAEMQSLKKYNKGNKNWLVNMRGLFL